MKYIKNFLLFLILLFLFIFKDYFVIIPCSLLNIDINILSYSTKVLLSIIASSILIIITIIIYRNYLKEKLIDFKKHIKEYFDFGLKYWIWGLIGMAVSNILIGLFTTLDGANNEKLVQEMLHSAPLLSFISATIIAPFLEEILFRKSVYDMFHNKKLAIFMSGLIFGLLHVIFSMTKVTDLLYIIPYGMLGYSFAYILHKKDNIFVPIMFHMIHNGVLTILSIVLTVIK